MNKTGEGLAKWVEDIYAGGKHVYWYGTYCNPCTTSLLNGKTKQYPDHYTDGRRATYEKHIKQGKICTDCVGLIKGYHWEQDGEIKYKRNGLPDKGAKGMWGAAKIKGTIANGMPEIPGLLVWTKTQGHIAVYVGGGMVVEARGFSYGVQRNSMTKRAFTHWGLDPYIPYTEEAEALARKYMNGEVEETPAQESQKPAQEPQKPAQEPTKTQGGVNMPTLREGDKGTAVRILQRMLILRGCHLPRYGCDANYGEETKAAVKAYQTTHALTPDGICGPLTWAALAG